MCENGVNSLLVTNATGGVPFIIFLENKTLPLTIWHMWVKVPNWVNHIVDLSPPIVSLLANDSVRITTARLVPV